MHTVVIDIGKTNKKVVVFDDELKVVHQESEVLAQAEDEDGYPCEDLEALENWVDTTLLQMLEAYEVEFVNFSTYGATLVHLNGQGKSVTPVYNYLKPIETSFLRKLYAQHDGPRTFHAVTGSPPLGMLNAGFQMLWLRHERPQAFAKTMHSLHLPQYLSFRLTNRLHSEYTSVGCNTALWDFGRARYHDWVLDDRTIAGKLPHVGSTHDSDQVRWQGYSFRVGVGIHDSSAALHVYLKQHQQPFTLLSTGTWSIAFNAWDASPLTTYELSRDCLTFLQTNGKPVKAARLFLGYEHEVRAKELAEHYGVHDNNFYLVKYRRELDPIGEEPRFAWEHLGAFLERGSGRHFDDEDYQRAYHRLMRELTDLQLQQLDLIKGDRPLVHLIVDGGMARNDLFIEMLRQGLQNAIVEPAANPVGSALGAAMVIHPDYVNANH